GVGLGGLRFTGDGSAPVEQAVQAALQQRHQAGVPVAEHEQAEERNGNVVLVDDRVTNRGGEVCADRQFDPGDEAQTAAVFGCPHLVFLRFHAVLGGA